MEMVAIAAVAGVIGPGTAGADEPEAAAPRLYEMRTYITNEGKLDALHARFRDHTNKLFEKHGMTMVGYWTPVEGDEAGNTLVYILSYPSREARDASWKAFLVDPEWLKAYRASIEDGRLVKQVISKYLTPTDYSPLK
jgi:hypothetical protein